MIPFTNDTDYDAVVRAYPLLTATQERELAHCYQAGRAAAAQLAADPPADADRVALAAAVAAGQEARDRLVYSNLRLVFTWAQKYRGLGLEWSDLVQEGIGGLLRAIEKYQPERARFSTYAVWWIRQAIGRAVQDLGRAIRLPVHLYDDLRLIERAEEAILATNTPVTPETVAEVAGLRPQRVQSLWAAQMREPISLDRPLTPETAEITLGDCLAASSDTAATAVELAYRCEVAALLELLPDRERRIIELRYGLDGSGPRTLEQVGRALGMTRERARQIEALALKRLRPRAQELAFGPSMGE